MSQNITDRDAQYAIDVVKTICAEVGPGLPCTTQERERAAIVQKELESHLGADNVAVEEFACAPGAFLNTSLGVFCTVMAVLLNVSMGRFSGISPWITSLLASVFSIVPPLLFVLEFILCREVIDPLFPKKQSINVIGTLRRPEARTARRLLILSGHHDSAPENTWLRFTGYGFYFLSATYFLGSILLVVMCLIQLIGSITGNDAMLRMGTLKWALLVYPILPSVIYALLLTRGKKNGGNVPGAADNLSACAVAVALCRFLVENSSCVPEDTEIRFISFGCEEAGCRGSKRYVRRHLDELKRLDARLLNLETLAHPVVRILTSDTNGTVRNSPEMVSSLVAAAQRAGVPYEVAAASLGVGNDSSPFSLAGLRAATLLGFKVPQQQIAFYHQKWDTPEVLTIEPLLNVLKLTLEWIRNGGE